MPDIKGTQTEKNLLAAFAGESQARNRYSFAAGVAEKAGLLQIAQIFEETAENERVHAKTFFKFLEGGTVEITASYPAGKTGDVCENLASAAAGEREEWTELYPKFADTAKEEGFSEVSATFRAIARVEKEHEARFARLLERVKTETVFKREIPTKWVCIKCGHVHEGLEAPRVCPACKHDQKHFFEKPENY